MDNRHKYKNQNYKTLRRKYVRKHLLRTLKAQVTREKKRSKLDFIKIKNLYASKENI